MQSQALFEAESKKNNWIPQRKYPGFYTFYTRDANGCTVTMQDTIYQPEEIKITKEETDNSGQLCNGDSNGIIIITAIGGTGLLEYSIDSGYSYLPNNTFSGLGGGEYYVFVRDANSCAVKGGKPFIQNPPLLYISSYAQMDITSCYDDPTGKIVIEGSGGSLPLEYILDAADTNQTGIFENWYYLPCNHPRIPMTRSALPPLSGERYCLLCLAQG